MIILILAMFVVGWLGAHYYLKSQSIGELDSVLVVGTITCLFGFSGLLHSMEPYINKQHFGVVVFMAILTAGFGILLKATLIKK